MKPRINPSLVNACKWSVPWMAFGSCSVGWSTSRLSMHMTIKATSCVAAIKHSGEQGRTRLVMDYNFEIKFSFRILCWCPIEATRNQCIKHVL